MKIAIITIAILSATYAIYILWKATQDKVILPKAKQIDIVQVEGRGEIKEDLQEIFN